MSRLQTLLLLFCFGVPILGALVLLVWVLQLSASATVSIARSSLLVYSGVFVLASAVPLLALVVWRRRTRSLAHVELVAAGIEPGDYELVRTLFPRSSDVRLSPLASGYSGAAVFRAQSWGGAALQRSTVVKIGPTAKLQPEIENYERYVREYIGNTAALLGHAQQHGRTALRWSYAAFSGENVQTLAEYAQSHPIASVIADLFGSRATLGLLLGTPRRDPQRALFREYSWTPREWARLVEAAAPLLRDDPMQPTLPWSSESLPNPLAVAARWWGEADAVGERLNELFDAPVTTCHGDLNSRNILLDERGTIFVIDFSHTRPGHALRDFARLEAELWLGIDPPNAANAHERISQFFALLPTTPNAALRDVLALPPAPNEPVAAVVALRRRAHDLVGPWLDERADQYLLPLLFATLETLRYAQSSDETRRAALVMASHLCAAMAQSGSLAHATPR